MCVTLTLVHLFDFASLFPVLTAQIHIFMYILVYILYAYV